MVGAETRDKRVQAFVVEAVRRSRRFALSSRLVAAFERLYGWFAIIFAAKAKFYFFILN